MKPYMQCVAVMTSHLFCTPLVCDKQLCMQESPNCVCVCVLCVRDSVSLVVVRR